MDYQIEMVQTDDASISEIQALMCQVFENRRDKFTFDYLKWQYKENPIGEVVGFNAYSNNILVAHYATMPIKMMINGESIKGLLSLNTATHPDHQGHRLFTKLADTTYNYAKERGYKFVIGVANNNSTHGFLKNLGFNLISPLDFKIGIGDVYKYCSIRNKNYIQYDDTYLAWRFRCPAFKYSSKGNTIHGNRKEPFFHTAVSRKINAVNLRKTFDVFNIYIGIGLEKVGGLYVNLPSFINRSPFNLIFKDLSDGFLPQINKNNILFQLLDFDVA